MASEKKVRFYGISMRMVILGMFCIGIVIFQECFNGSRMLFQKVISNNRHSGNQLGTVIQCFPLCCHIEDNF